MHRTGGLEIALVDGRDFAVQAREISAQFADLITRHKPWLARRAASVVPSHLSKLQAERTGKDLPARYFIDMADAQAWLFGASAGGQVESS